MDKQENFMQEHEQKMNLIYEEKKQEKYDNKSICVSSPTVQELSEEEKIISILQAPRNLSFVSAISKADEMTEQDFEIMDMTYEHMEKQQEELLGKENVDQLLYTLTKCYIPGCKVHTLYRDFIHYGDFVDNGYDERPINSMSDRLKKGYDVYCNHPGCLSVEIYEKHICVVEISGKTTVAEE